jgi:hypothetical protein
MLPSLGVVCCLLCGVGGVPGTGLARQPGRSLLMEQRSKPFVVNFTGLPRETSLDVAKCVSLAACPTAIREDELARPAVLVGVTEGSMDPPLYGTYQFSPKQVEEFVATMSKYQVRSFRPLCSLADPRWLLDIAQLV